MKKIFTSFILSNMLVSSLVANDTLKNDIEIFEKVLKNENKVYFYFENTALEEETRGTYLLSIKKDNLLTMLKNKQIEIKTFISPYEDNEVRISTQDIIEFKTNEAIFKATKLINYSNNDFEEMTREDAIYLFKKSMTIIKNLIIRADYEQVKKYI